MFTTMFSQEQQPISLSCSGCNGWLWKLKRGQRGMIIPQWNKRFFIIQGCFLKWYKSPNDTDESGSIDLSEVSRLTQFETKGSFSFIVSHPDRNLLLRASSINEMNKWVRALNVQTEAILRGGASTNGINNANNYVNIYGQNDSNNANQSLARKINGSLPPKTKSKGGSLEAELDRALSALNNLEIELKNAEKNKNREDHLITSSSNRNIEQQKQQNEKQTASLSSSSNSLSPNGKKSNWAYSNSDDIEASIIRDKSRKDVRTISTFDRSTSRSNKSITNTNNTNETYLNVCDEGSVSFEDDHWGQHQEQDRGKTKSSTASSSFSNNRNKYSVSQDNISPEKSEKDKINLSKSNYILRRQSGGSGSGSGIQDPPLRKKEPVSINPYSHSHSANSFTNSNDAKSSRSSGDRYNERGSWRRENSDSEEDEELPLSRRKKAEIKRVSAWN